MGLNLANASLEEILWVSITVIGMALNLLETLDSRKDLKAIEIRHGQVISGGVLSSREVRFLQRVDAVRLAGKRNYRAAIVRTVVMAFYVLVGVLAIQTAPPVRPPLELLSVVVAFAFIGSSFLLMLNSAMDRRDRARLLELFEIEAEANPAGGTGLSAG